MKYPDPPEPVRPPPLHACPRCRQLVHSPGAVHVIRYTTTLCRPEKKPAP